MSGTNATAPRSEQGAQGRYYSFDRVFSVLSRNDARRLHGYVGERLNYYTLAELVERGVSDEGIAAVLRGEEVQDAPAGEVEPGSLPGFGLEDVNDLVEAVVVRVNFEDRSVQVQLDHGVSLSVVCCGDCHSKGSPCEGGRA